MSSNHRVDSIMVYVELVLVIMASPAFLARFKDQVCSQESGVGGGLGTSPICFCNVL